MLVGLLVSCVLLCACANGLAARENKATPTPLVYETYADDRRYLFVPTPEKWTEIAKVCRMYNGHLAFPKTQDEADALWSIMIRYNVKQVHAGFHDQFLEGEYYTVKGRLMNETSFNKWSVGAPVGSSSLNCGGLRRDGLVDVACKYIAPAICETDEPSGNDGFLDYEYIEGHGYYKHYLRNYSWVDAMRHCRNEESHLLILNSEEELSAVFSRFNITPSAKEIIVGFHHYITNEDLSNKDFVTIFDDTLASTGYNKWAPNGPIGPDDFFRYGSITASGLYRISALDSLNFICEFNPPN